MDSNLFDISEDNPESRVRVQVKIKKAQNKPLPSMSSERCLIYLFSHFAVEIAAEAFEGKTRVAAHRMIYALFADLIPHEIHALRIVMVHQGM